MAKARRGRRGAACRRHEADEIVLGGGNVKKLNELPPHSREGDNDNAFVGGFRLWEEAQPMGPPRKPPPTAGCG